MSAENWPFPLSSLEDIPALTSIAALHQVSLRVHQIATLDCDHQPLTEPAEYRLQVSINHLAAGVVILACTPNDCHTSWQSSPVLLTPQTSVPFPIEIHLTRTGLTANCSAPEYSQIQLLCDLQTGWVRGTGMLARLGDRVFYSDLSLAKTVHIGLWFSVLP
ncbi:hypothetical protein [Sphaerothrix gracilis]|uniref:hypothetical protein n=1 Tax=Sphaerothrix gracilis TaxID=3151835 RepID=UPI0031FBB00A